MSTQLSLYYSPSCHMFIDVYYINKFSNIDECMKFLSENNINEIEEITKYDSEDYANIDGSDDDDYKNEKYTIYLQKTNEFHFGKYMSCRDHSINPKPALIFDYTITNNIQKRIEYFQIILEMYGVFPRNT